MVGDDDMQPQPDFDQGGKRTREGPGDHPGRARGVAFVLVVTLALIVLAVPVAWGAGYLVRLSEVLGPAAYALLWAIWAIVLVVTVWTAWSMWKRAA